MDTVRSICLNVVDNASANWKFITDFLYQGSLTTSVSASETGQPIFVIFDPVHDVKTVYNSFGRCLTAHRVRQYFTQRLSCKRQACCWSVSLQGIVCTAPSNSRGPLYRMRPSTYSVYHMHAAVRPAIATNCIIRMSYGKRLRAQNFTWCLTLENVKLYELAVN